jgi:hypothetical protein
MHGTLNAQSIHTNRLSLSRRLTMASVRCLLRLVAIAAGCAGTTYMQIHHTMA